MTYNVFIRYISQILKIYKLTGLHSVTIHPTSVAWVWSNDFNVYGFCIAVVALDLIDLGLSELTPVYRNGIIIFFWHFTAIKGSSRRQVVSFLPRRGMAFLIL